MKRLLLSILAITLLVALSACAAANIAKTTTQKGDETCTASYKSLFRTYDGVNMSACGAKGKAENVQESAVGKALVDTLIKGLQK